MPYIFLIYFSKQCFKKKLNHLFFFFWSFSLFSWLVLQFQNRCHIFIGLLARSGNKKTFMMYKWLNEILLKCR